MKDDIRGKMEKILILLATYNGEEYIATQLESLKKQTYGNFEVIISDDCSTDKTIEIIKQNIKVDNRFFLIEQRENIGALKNFNFLINVAKTKNINYIMFCDQDDFWLEDKIKVSYENIKKIKNDVKLLYTKKKLVDKNLKSIEKKIKYKNEETDLKVLLHQNPIYGCTMIINKKLLNLLENKIPKEFINHDHYIAIMAKIYGEIFYLNKETILYRQHENNVSGSIMTPLYKKVLNKTNLKKNINAFYFIINYLLVNHQGKLSHNEEVMLKNLQQKFEKGDKIGIIIYMIKNRIFKLTFKGTLNFYFQIFIRKRYDE